MTWKEKRRKLRESNKETLAAEIDRRVRARLFGKGPCLARTIASKRHKTKPKNTVPKNKTCRGRGCPSPSLELETGPEPGREGEGRDSPLARNKKQNIPHYDLIMPTALNTNPYKEKNPLPIFSGSQGAVMERVNTENSEPRSTTPEEHLRRGRRRSRGRAGKTAQLSPVRASTGPDQRNGLPPNTREADRNRPSRRRSQIKPSFNPNLDCNVDARDLPDLVQGPRNRVDRATWVPPRPPNFHYIPFKNIPR